VEAGPHQLAPDTTTGDSSSLYNDNASRPSGSSPPLVTGAHYICTGLNKSVNSNENCETVKSVVLDVDNIDSKGLTASKMLGSPSPVMDSNVITRVLRSSVRSSDSTSSNPTMHVSFDMPGTTGVQNNVSSAQIDNATITSSAINDRLLRKRSEPSSTSPSTTFNPKRRSKSRVVSFEHLDPGDRSADRCGKLEDYAYLLGTIHRDDDDMLLYKVTKIYIHKATGFIVGDRVLVLKDGSTYKTDEFDPIHVKDLAILTKRYEKERNKDNMLRSNLAHLVGGPIMTINELHENFKSNISSKYNAYSNDVPSTLDADDFERLLKQSDYGDQLVDFCLQTTCSQVEIFTPLTRRQAVSGPQRDQWLLAEQNEINSIISNEVLLPAILPFGRKPLRTKWVYKLKHGATGELKSYKVRLVANGYAQIF